MVLTELCQYKQTKILKLHALCHISAYLHWDRIAKTQTYTTPSLVGARAETGLAIIVTKNEPQNYLNGSGLVLGRSKESCLLELSINLIKRKGGGT